MSIADYSSDPKPLLMSSSIYLTPRAYKGLLRVGDLLLPGTAQMPAFSATGSIGHVDHILTVTPATDRKELIQVLILFSFLPHWALKKIMGWAGHTQGMPSILARQLRLLDIGLRGVVFSLYYSGLNDGLTQTPNVHKSMDYQLDCQTLD